MTLSDGMITGGISFLSLVAGYVLRRPKIKADAVGSELDNVEKAVTIWRNLAGDMDKRVQTLQAQVNSLMEQNKVKDLRIAHLARELNELRNQAGMPLLPFPDSTEQ